MDNIIVSALVSLDWPRNVDMKLWLMKSLICVDVVDRRFLHFGRHAWIAN